MNLSTLANLAQVVSVIPLLGGVGLILHRVRCQEPGCYRLGHPARDHRCHRHAPRIDPKEKP